MEEEAIRLAREADAVAEAERIQRAKTRHEEAYAYLKPIFPLLERRTDDRFTLCGRVWGYDISGITLDGQAGYSLISPAGDTVYDMVSLGRWLLRERDRPLSERRTEAHAKPSFWRNLFG